MNIQNAIENLKSRGFEVSFFEHADDACDYLKAEIHNTTVGFGGSMTLKELNLFEILSEKNTLWNHWVQADRNSALEGASKAEVYITSANAIAETGEIINIDGAGNRISSTLFNKKKVYIIVGTNKFSETYDDALWRARNIASPLNAQRLKVNTPCAANADRCYDCRSPERICKGLVVLWGKLSGVDELEVIIINEKLGF